MPSDVFVPSQYSTIQDGINAVDPGGTVHVAPGIYPTISTILVNKPVTILGPQANVDPRPNCFTTRSPGDLTTEAIVDGAFTTSVIFRIAANDVTINGLEVRRGTGDLIDSLASAPIKFRTKVLYNIIHDSSGDEGIQLRNVTNGIISFNHVYNTAGDGINFCCGTTASTISFNEVHAINSPDAAIYVYNSTNMTIERNLVYDVKVNDGIKLGDSGGTDVSSTGGIILNNIVHDVNQDGITLYTSNTTIQGNEIYRSRSDNGALFLDFNIRNINITNNCIHNNGVIGDGRTTYGIHIGKGRNLPTGVTVNFNNIFNNPDGELFYNSNSTPALNAVDNWWGSSSGPPPGSIVGNIDYIPFLEEALPVCNPYIICPGDFTVNNDTGQCSATVTFTVTAGSNDCGITEITCNPGGTRTFSPPEQSVSITETQPFSVGSTLVTCTATNSSGDTTQCSFTVTVIDTEPPTIQCPDNVIVTVEPGETGTIVNYPNPTVSDNCQDATFLCTPSSGSFFPVGTTKVTCSATDAARNTVTCSFEVNVRQMERLQLECISVEKVFDWVVVTNHQKNWLQLPKEGVHLINKCLQENKEITVLCKEKENARQCFIVGERQLPVSNVRQLTISSFSYLETTLLCKEEKIYQFEIPIHFIQDIVACHPKGTNAFCRIVDVSCSTPKIVEGTVLYDVVVCLELEVVGNVKLVLYGESCNPRRNYLM
ncbi:HYR domain-containing protein [Neobacillus mesonae]|uniref:HYR domain-containing protein n=1 Tax=Neobacillus mesonae TaxID=1193713 RepID=UPI00203CFA20|nr:HYR domain-containing protein [Neobacillus mesonae]MCM3568576.1 HYR domain-containing protein [Neobacillus mesonae]